MQGERLLFYELRRRIMGNSHSIYNFYKEIEGQNTTFLKEQSFISPKNDTFALELKVLNLHGKFESFKVVPEPKPQK